MKENKPIIEWKYFFGGSIGYTFDRYYKAEINGKIVEKHASNTGTLYAIGNIDKAKKKYKTEAALLKALKQTIIPCGGCGETNPDKKCII